LDNLDEPAKARLAPKVKANTIRDVLSLKAFLVGLRFVVLSLLAAGLLGITYAGAVALIGFSEND